MREMCATCGVKVGETHKTDAPGNVYCSQDCFRLRLDNLDCKRGPAPSRARWRHIDKKLLSEGRKVPKEYLDSRQIRKALKDGKIGKRQWNQRK